MVSEKDTQILSSMVKEYPVLSLVEALAEIIQNRANRLVDLEMKDAAKELSIISAHLELLTHCVDK
jgi:hypothetical protein